MKLISQHIATRFKKHKLKLSVTLIVFILWLFCLPVTLFEAPTSTVIESSEGVMLGARIADDEQWRFPQMDSIPYRFEQCLLQFEDAHFYSHPGVNPVSISKAIWGNLTTEKRRGGSTLTQQVIRLSRKNKQRTYFEKVIEMVQATRLEAGYSKKEILNLYATHAPFGGNVVGLETAAWRYFGIPASELSWGQSAALAVLPNAPSLIFPGKNEALLKKKRDRLLKKLFQEELIDATTFQLALDEDLPGKPMALPELAPHLTERIRQKHPGLRITTSIEVALQQKLNRIASEHHYVLQQNQIHNMAILVMDVETRKVLAYVGNAPTTPENNNYVDIITKPRSTGSILKPFLFASLMDSGELLPNSLVADVPIVINGYQPENFDQQFQGAVSASQALSRSLNVPAVGMLRDYGLERFYNKLQKTNFSHINKGPNYYGLSLILGGAESSLWDITASYAGMASTLNFFNQSSSEYRSKEFVSPSFLKDGEVSLGTVQLSSPIFNAGAIYHTFKALNEVNRPQGEELWSFFNNGQPIAWKTGTSYGFKDAWAVGVTTQYAIGVWVGNADGEGRPGLTGIQAAAPVLFDVLDVLPKSDWFATPYDELIEAEICDRSGQLAGVFCDKAVQEFIPKKGLRTLSCEYHQKVFLDATETQRVNSSCYPLAEMKQQSWFALPPTMEYYYAAQHPEYQPLPSFASGCLQDGEQTMEFLFPKKNETILIPKNFDETKSEVIFKVAHRNPEIPIFWYLDDTFIGATETFHELALTPKPGTYELIATDYEGYQLKQQVTIAVISAQ